MSTLYRGKSKKEVSLATSLYDAIEDANFSAVHKLLTEKHSDPNLVIQKHGIAPFHLIVGNDDEDFALKVTKLILQHGGDPNVKSDEWITPMHIAAALGRPEILKLLLMCGGDPELEDLNNFTPLYYAKNENHQECFEMLTKYLTEYITAFFNRERQDCKKYQLTLDKILVNNGTTTGEYEVVNEYKTKNLPNEAVQKLEDLPQANTNEYIMNWFKNIPRKTSQTCVPTIDLTTDSDTSDHTLNESDNENNKDLANMSFRKRYTKTMARRKLERLERKHSTASAPLGSSPKSNRSEPNDVIKTNLPKIEIHGVNDTLYTYDLNADVTARSPLSTPPNDYIPNGVIKTNLPKIKIHGVNDTLLEHDLNSDLKARSPLSTPPSDYVSMEDDATLERNIFEITGDSSHHTSKGTATAKNDGTNRSFRSSFSKSEGIGSSDLSFISAVSEVYKYVDDEEDVVLYEKRLLKTSVRGSVKTGASVASLPTNGDYEDIDPDTLRKELTELGYNPGPITVTTKRIYLKKLQQLRSNPVVAPSNNDQRVYSGQLEKTLRNSKWYRDLDSYKHLEDVLLRDFTNPDPSKKWREGTSKSSFTYLLLDPRITENLPSRAEDITPSEIWEKFLSAIFYVGKGKRSRPYSHLYEAVNLWKQQKRTSDNKKLNRILNIWNDNCGVICLHVFQNTIPVEAYTREAAMISALSLNNLSNIKPGDFYGTSSTWSRNEKNNLGVLLLHRAMLIFINEGERQLCPSDVD